MQENLKRFFYVLIIIIVFGALIRYLFLNYEKKDATLIMVHLLFRHGHRHPDKISICPSGPYYDEKYYPEGYGQLTNIGKKRLYDVGTYLRTRYTGFLGQWNRKRLEVRSSDYDRTKMSLQLVLAGLYPPTGFQVWSSIPWQPIPYSYVPKLQDKELLPYFACPNYNELANKLYGESTMKQYLRRYDETFKILEEKYGKKKVHVMEAFYMFSGLKIQEELGYPLEEWTKAVYPEPLHSAMIDLYYLMSNTTEIRRIITGYFFKKLLTDTKNKINGTIVPAERDFFIYSAHEINVATTLTMLGTELSEVPPYGSYILFEIHKIDKIYGFKIFYQNYTHYEPTLLRIGGCDYFCPFDEFYRLMEEYLPNNDEECFGKKSL